MKLRFKILLKLMLITFSMVNSFGQSLPLVYAEENTGKNCKVPALPNPDLLPNYSMLPDPFSWSDGSGRSTDFADWECRRNEIKAEIEAYEIGTKPIAPAKIIANYTNGVLTVEITENGETLTLTSKVTIPTGEGPFPVIIGMNSPNGSIPAAIVKNAIKIPFMHNQVVSYSQGGRNPSDPYFKLYPHFNPAPDTYLMGNYSAWAWGVSRLIDGIEIIKAEINADLAHIAVTGCSYAGKMALFAGAFDERIALTIAQESGGGGAPAWRVSETTANVEKISNTNYSWFLPNMGTNFGGRASALPHDHHELMAMVAPRALLVTANTDFEWLANESAYVSSRATQEVYRTFGIEERFGFYIDGSHAHCAIPETQAPAVKAFVDKFIFGDIEANTNVYVHPYPDTNYEMWIKAWQTQIEPD